ncbi:MAG: glycosyltransferase family 2 protein [Ignavibacteria bacterium]|nr:glycosyltransferase family 2 protein [Ignavibacteria bacterium]
MLDDPDVSIVIVTWNSADDIRACLTGANASLGSLRGEFIIVDNASVDETVNEINRAVSEGVHNINVILNNFNSGFAKACNQGILVSKGRNILLLNPDTEAAGDCIELLNRKLESDRNLGAVAPQLRNPDKSVQHSCRSFPEFRDMWLEFTMLPSLFPENRFLSRWKMGYFSHSEEMTVDQPMAAALLVRGGLLRELGGFDEQFVMFFNDVDLCKRIYEKGFKIIFTPDAVMYHEKGASVKKRRTEMIDAWNEDCIRYFRKHFDKPVQTSLLGPALKASGAIRKIYHKAIS